MSTLNSSNETETNTLPIGFSLAEFRIEQVIGEGGFGIVYLALDTQLGRKVAIKEYMPSSLAARKNDLSVTVTSPRHRETFDLGLRSFVKEAITLARFDHPALLKVFRFWEERGTAYMVMPYLEGQTLKQHLRARSDAPPEAWLRAILEPVFDGLEHLHANNCLHRDIAPDNIQILPNGVPLLMDFGAARQVIGDATQALTVILKPGFAPVEQYSDSTLTRQGAWTDVYALAAVCYYAISGKTPQASVARVMNDELPSAMSIGAQRYSPEFLNFIDVCLRVRPGDRPQSIREARDVMLGRSAGPAYTAPLVAVDDDKTIIRAPARAAASTQGPAPAVPSRAPAATITPPTPEPLQRQPAAAASAPSSARRTGMMALGAAAAVGVVLAAWKFWPTVNPTLVPGVAGAASMAASAPTTVAAAPSAATTQATAPAPPPAPAPAPAPPPAAPAPAPLPVPTSAAAAVDQIIAGSSAATPVASQPTKAALVVGLDTLEFNVRSGVKGYVYVFAAEPNAGTLTLLFPNALDPDNRIDAGAELALPRSAWKRKVEAPSGTRTILSVVSAYPRDLQTAGWRRGATYSTYAPGATDAASVQPPVLGAPVCDSGAACDARYGAASFQVTVAEPTPVAKEERPPPAAAPAKKPTDAAPRVAKPTTDNARQCAQLLQQASMGQDTPDLARKMAALNCR